METHCLKRNFHLLFETRVPNRNSAAFGDIRRYSAALTALIQLPLI
ncbi:hypothetical protein PAMC26577_40135 [Caballeronia sordidicola]|uniref:Uncharacterized protein n=1 Tax=Caballeronia sordidicola TaxID=196367 RepID=A0A242M2W5_CABSO|nr:hypothetical protein PAMC26577_40135 [Caballeronia sordidicola]